MLVVLLAGGATAINQNAREPAADQKAPPSVSAPTLVEGRVLLAQGVRDALDAGFLTPLEARALRLKHGVPLPADLASGPPSTWTDAALVAARAQTALLCGAWDDPSLIDQRADVLDRAEALLQRGQPAQALALLAPVAPDAGRARRAALRLQGAMMAPGLDAAAREAAVVDALALVKELGTGKLGGAQETVEVVQLAATLVRQLGAERVPGADHQALLGHLASARAADGLLWSVPAVEGELLLEKDNYAQARNALAEASKLNPSAARVWLTGGLMAVASFDFDNAERMAERLDRAAQVPALGVPEGRPEDKPEAKLEHPAHPEPAQPEPAQPEPAQPEPAPASAMGAVVRARALLRQDGSEPAAALIDAQLARFPDAPLLLAIRAGVLAGGYRFDELTAALDHYEAKFSGHPNAAFVGGQVLADLRQYEKAAVVLGRAQRLAPSWAQPAVELGLLEVQSGRNEQALAALERAFVLDPFNVRADNSLRLLRDLSGFSSVEGEHFIVRAKGELDTLLAREMLPVLEAIHGRVAGDGPGELSHTPARRTVIELMPNHASFAVRIAGLPRLHTIAASTGPVIAMEAPRDGRGHSGAYDWERVLQHEYVHTVGLSRTSNRMPHWFTEAQAVYLERRERDYPTVQLLQRAFEQDELFDLEQINIAFTRPKRPTDRALAYAQGHWMYQFMSQTFGDQAPLKLMDRFAKGQRLAEALQAELGVSPAQFLAQFRPWAATQLIAWGVQTPAGVPSAAALLGTAQAGGPQDAALDGAPDGQLDAKIAAALEAHPDHADVLELALRRASEAAASGVLSAKAIEIAQRYAQARPVDPLPHRMLARHFLATDAAAATSHLRWLDAREEREPTYAAQVATLLVQQGDLAGAGQYAERAVRISPYGGQLRELAATIAVQRRELPTARRHLEFLALLEPQNPKHQARLTALKRLESESTQRP